MKKTTTTRPAILYAYASCSTCRDAIKWLRAHDVTFVERPIYDSPPSVDELRRMLAYCEGNLRRLFNSSGLEYRALGIAGKLPELSEAEALALLAGNGRLVKRPFLLTEEFGLLGFKPSEWDSAFA